ncbi:hypothetical protein MtrunA17_Chr6g0485941 [Medicago truncatula]|uniref:Uncharacterized protein n=1 Tax=Medicago truncatula TaxID=3880 RepID=A0A396HKE4_MEDTR|nr:hypothetical protein MtrunA17_Chr6g0485941 [Medicago truncatula]
MILQISFNSNKRDIVHMQTMRITKVVVLKYASTDYEDYKSSCIEKAT